MALSCRQSYPVAPANVNSVCNTVTPSTVALTEAWTRFPIRPRIVAVK